MDKQVNQRFSCFPHGIRKRGFMAIYLPILTLFMCGLVIGMYVLESKDLDSSLVSPRAIWELEDKQDIFEMWEDETILRIAKEKGFSNVNEIKTAFCVEFAKEQLVLDFVFEDLIVNDVAKSKDIFDENARESFCNKNYNFEYDGKLKVVRAELEKRKTLFANIRSKINFAVDYSYVYSREMEFGGG